MEKGKEPKSQTVVSFFADPPIEENEQTRVEAATEVLEIALRDILREELGETYSVSVGLSQSTPQRGGGHIDIWFSASPDNVDKMVAPRAAGGRAAADGRAVRGSDARARRRPRGARTKPRSSRTASGSAACSRPSCSAAIRC